MLGGYVDLLICYISETIFKTALGVIYLDSFQLFKL